jgi:hypothetical protein
MVPEQFSGTVIVKGGGNFPLLDEPLISRQDVALGIDDQYAVESGFLLGTEDCEPGLELSD